MYNRLLNIKKDFGAVNEFQNEKLPMLDSIKDPQKREELKTYFSQIFFNQWKQKNQ